MKKSLVLFLSSMCHVDVPNYLVQPKYYEWFSIVVATTMSLYRAYVEVLYSWPPNLRNVYGPYVAR